MNSNEFTKQLSEISNVELTSRLKNMVRLNFASVIPPNLNDIDVLVFELIKRFENCNTELKDQIVNN